VVEDADDAAAHARELALEPDLVRVHVHETVLQAQAAGAEEALVDPGRPQHAAGEVADDRQRLPPQDTAGQHHADAGCLRKGGRDHEPVRDDHELALLPELQRQVVRGRAAVERDRLAVGDHRRRGLRDRPLLGAPAG
jgi:hypothetical protein